MISFNLRASGDSKLKVFWAWVVLAAPVVMTCDFWPLAITKVISLWRSKAKGLVELFNIPQWDDWDS